MQVSDNCRTFIAHFEGVELRAYPDPNSPLGRECAAHSWPMRRYQDLPGWAYLPGDPWTIGYGATGPGIGPGVSWSLPQARARLDADIAERVATANRVLTHNPGQGPFDAFVSILFNVGHGNPQRDGIIQLRGGGPSTLLRKLQAGDLEGARFELGKWISRGTPAERGLRRRRAGEQALWDGATAAQAIAIAERAA